MAIAASAKRPSTCGEAEKGGFISTTLGRIAGSSRSWICSALCRVTATSRKRRPSSPARVSAISFNASRALRQFGEDREQAGAGRGFEHEIGRRQHGRFGGGKAERQRRRELLEVLGFLRAPRLRREPPGEPRQHLEHRRGRARAACASPRRICAGTAPAPLRAPRRRLSMPTPLRRRCRRRRPPSRSARRGCRARGPGRAIAPAGLRRGSGPTPCRAGPAAGTAGGWPQRVPRRRRKRAWGRSPRAGVGEPGQALSFSVRVHPLPAFLSLFTDDPPG